MEKFNRIIESYEENNKTLTLTTEELVYYIMDDDESEGEVENGTSRLLLGSDGVISLINFSK